MTVLSRLTPSLLKTVTKVKPACWSMIVRDGGGGARHFIIKKGPLENTRFRDQCHLYMWCLGFAPYLFILTGLYIVQGPCELTDWPADGYSPRFWQFERSPMRQYYARFADKHGMPLPFVSQSPYNTHDLRYHESKLAVQMWRAKKTLMKQQLARVQHLQHQRMDYKGWYYLPVDSTWIDRAKLRADHYRFNDVETLHLRYD